MRTSNHLTVKTDRHSNLLVEPKPSTKPQTANWVAEETLTTNVSASSVPLQEKADDGDYVVVKQIKTDIVAEPSLVRSPSFDYDNLDIETRTQVQQRTREIKTLVRNNASSILQIGEKLTKVQSLLHHDKKGGFRGWLDAEFGWNYRTAYNFIRVWEKFGNCENFSQLDIAISALYLLAAPSTPKPALASAKAIAAEGVRITHKRAKEIIAEYKPQNKPKNSPFDKEALAEDTKNLIISGDLVELLNPPVESGWSPGDRAVLEDVSYETRTVLLKLDPHQIGRQFKSFGFDEIKKVDRSKPQQAVLSSTPTITTIADSLKILSNPTTLKELEDNDLKATLKSLQQNLKAIKLEITRRHQANQPAFKASNSDRNARSTVMQSNS